MDMHWAELLERNKIIFSLSLSDQGSPIHEASVPAPPAPKKIRYALWQFISLFVPQFLHQKHKDEGGHALRMLHETAI